MKTHLIFIALVSLALTTPALASESAASSRAFSSAVQEYDNGRYKRAYKAFKRLAKNGNQSAQQNLAVMLAKGQGTDVDLVESAAWLTVAAIDNDPQVLNMLDEILLELDDPSLAQVIERSNQLLQQQRDRTLRRHFQPKHRPSVKLGSTRPNNGYRSPRRHPHARVDG